MHQKVITLIFSGHGLQGNVATAEAPKWLLNFLYQLLSEMNHCQVNVKVSFTLEESVIVAETAHEGFRLTCWKKS